MAKAKTKMIRTLLAMLMAVFMVGAWAAPAYAEDPVVNPVEQLAPNDNLTASLVNELNTATQQIKGVDFDILTYDYGTGKITFDAQRYDKVPLTQRRTIMKTLLKGIGDSTLAPVQKTKLYNFVADRDTEISHTLTFLQSNTSNTLQRGEAFFSPAAHLIGTVVGILCMVIALFLAFGIVIDLVYMVSPPARMFLDRVNAKNHAWGVSTEATYAVTASENASGSGTWKNYMALYLKTRGFTMFIIMAVLTLVVTGKIWEPLMYLASALGF